MGKYFFNYKKDNIIELINKIITEDNIETPFLILSNRYSPIIENLKEYDRRKRKISEHIFVEYIDVFDKHFTLNGNEIEVLNFN